jgi:hypothetical protein
VCCTLVGVGTRCFRSDCRCVVVSSAKLTQHGQETARCCRLVHRALYAITWACVSIERDYVKMVESTVPRRPGMRPCEDA